MCCTANFSQSRQKWLSGIAWAEYYISVVCVVSVKTKHESYVGGGLISAGVIRGEYVGNDTVKSDTNGGCVEDFEVVAVFVEVVIM